MTYNLVPDKDSLIDSIAPLNPQSNNLWPGDYTNFRGFLKDRTGDSRNIRHYITGQRRLHEQSFLG
jgi:hypothetical protein